MDAFGAIGSESCCLQSLPFRPNISLQLLWPRTARTLSTVVPLAALGAMPKHAQTVQHSVHYLVDIVGSPKPQSHRLGQGQGICFDEGIFGGACDDVIHQPWALRWSSNTNMTNGGMWQPMQAGIPTVDEHKSCSH